MAVATQHPIIYKFRLTVTQGPQGPKLLVVPLGNDLFPEAKELGGVMRWSKWMFPPIYAFYQRIVDCLGDEVDISPPLKEKMKTPGGMSLIITPVEIAEQLPVELVSKLYHYQMEAIQFLVSSPHEGSLLALAPGMGKSLVSIVAARILHAKRILVVSPLSLLPNWKHEILLWGRGTETIKIAHKQSPTPSTWTITNYDTVRIRLKEYLKTPWDLIIIDESIQICNRKSQRSEIITLLCNKTKTWLLSGNPVAKTAGDLFSQFRAIDKTYFRSYWRFVKTYCILEESVWATKVIGTKRTLNARETFKDLMFSRNHKDNLPDLPQLIFKSVVTEMHPRQQKMYFQILDQFLIELESGEQLKITAKLAQLIRLQQCVSNPRNLDPDWKWLPGKLSVLLDLIKTNQIPFPSIIWTHWRKGAEEIRIELEEGLRLNVGHAVSGSSGEIENFKQGKRDILILPLGVGKFGHTLINARSMIYYDKTWNADDYYQSLARVKGRIGLKHRPVIFTLKSPGTIDDLITQNLRTKMTSIAKISNESLSELLKGLK